MDIIIMNVPKLSYNECIKLLENPQSLMLIMGQIKNYVKHQKLGDH